MSRFTFLKRTLILAIPLSVIASAIAWVAFLVGSDPAYYLPLVWLPYLFSMGGGFAALLGVLIFLLSLVPYLLLSALLVSIHGRIVDEKNKKIFIILTSIVIFMLAALMFNISRPPHYSSIQDCENFSDSWYMPRDASKQKCFLSIAVKRQDVTVCNNIKSPLEPELENDGWDSAQDFRGYCIGSAMPTRVDEKLKNVSKCALLEESESRDDCYYRVVYSAERLPTEKSKEICALITEIERKNSCFLRVIDSSGDVNVCRSLVNPNDGTFDATLASCYLGVVESKKLSLLSEGQKTCALITSNHYSTGVTVPRDRCFQALAERYKDINICLNIEDSDWKSGCESRVTWAIKKEIEELPLKEQRERSCALMDDNSPLPRDPCFRSLAERYRDITICSNIQDGELKTKCEEYFVPL